jgi:hypothetical protein
MTARLSLLLVPALLAATLATAAGAGGFQLLSAGEYRSELAARAAPGAKLSLRGADLDAPTITVVAPAGSAAITPPVDIDLRFKAAPGATVDPKTLKILYGFLKIDVTQRIVSAPGVEISAAGLKAAGARLPSGDHKLLIEVADNLGRTARQPLEFTVH